MRQYDRKKNNYPHLDFPDIYILEGGYKSWHESFGKSYDLSYLEMENFFYKQEMMKMEKERKLWMSECHSDLNNRVHMRFITPSPMPLEKNIWDSSPLSRVGSPMPLRKVYDDSPLHIRNSSSSSDFMEI